MTNHKHKKNFNIKQGQNIFLHSTDTKWHLRRIIQLKNVTIENQDEIHRKPLEITEFFKERYENGTQRGSQ